MKIYKRTKTKKKNKIVAFVLLFFILFVLFTVYILCFVDPIVTKSVYAEIDAIATTKVSDAIYDSLKKSGFKYDDLMSINYSSEGKVTSIITNSVNLNILARDVSTYAQNYVNEIARDGVDIAIGSFSGFSFLAGRGVKINFKLVPIGSLITSFKSKFTSAGINQTLHSLSIVVDVNIAVVLPFRSENIKFSTDLLVCENLIVGDIPEVYLDGNLIK